MPLWEIVELLKRELNLKGNSADVVAESCAQLNVADEGSLVDRAERCRGVLCGARGGARVVPAVEADVVAAGGDAAVVAAPARGAGVAAELMARGGAATSRYVAAEAHAGCYLGTCCLCCGYSYLNAVGSDAFNETFFLCCSCPIVQRWERVPVDTYQRDGSPNWFRNIDDLWLYKHLDTRDAHHENRGYCGLRVRTFE